MPVAQRRAKAERSSKQLKRDGTTPQPVRIQGRTIAQSFWGKAWCRHLEGFSDFENRLPRGRSYVRSGAVCDLRLQSGRIEAQVIGSSLYRVEVDIAALQPAAWAVLKRRCAGGIGSMLELLQGQLSEQVMRVVTDTDAGLFPNPGEMRFHCSCPDWADMCKHVAATLYGVGHRLDQQPELLFLLRGADPAELIGAGLETPLPAVAQDRDSLADDQLGAIFGIDFDEQALVPAALPAGIEEGMAITVEIETEAPPRRSSVTPAPAAAAGPKPPVFRATGKSIAALRRKLGLSMAEFARRLNVSPGSVQRWEAAGSSSLQLYASSLAALTALHREASRKAAAKPRK